jgi:hypothetical protein
MRIANADLSIKPKAKQQSQLALLLLAPLSTLSSIINKVVHPELAESIQGSSVQRERKELLF